jgi:HEPN domain-containing protein
MGAEEARTTLARRLMLAAREHLALGHRGLEAPPLPNGAVFHAQQAAEKALKAFLAWHDLPARPTHDLTELLSLCTPIQPEAEDALREGGAVVDFVVERLPS